MRIRALAFRILNQLRHDRRTMALMLAAPVFLLTLVYFILEDTSPVVSVAVINAPAGFEDKLEEYNVRGFRYGEQEARLALEQGEVIATIRLRDGKSFIEIDGSNPTKAKIALAALEQAKQPVLPARPDLKSEIHYVYGREDLPLFDMAGPTLIGFIIFFFVFLVSGISFLQERTSGTLEKLLSTPIRRWEIVVGYVLGFSLATVLQSFLISWYCVYVLKVMMIGSFFLILLITLLTAVVALTLGMLISTLANNEFQMIQFIPLVIVPQVFFSGLFDLPPAIANFGYLMPLYYIADALTEVMIRGRGLELIAGDLGVILAYSIGFMNLNTLFLKKYRRI
ncbi:MAG: ABC transporter permease [Clostridia bacterium]|jgi:ABC-2 type transport system permease protein|nr:ABC transporter permease [Clostridia bacterium]